MDSVRITFEGSLGNELAARLDAPAATTMRRRNICGRCGR